MTNEEVKKYIEFISNKDQSGATLPIEDFNTMLQVGNLEFYRDLREKYEANLEVTNSIKHLKVFDTALAIASGTGIADIPADYVYGGQVYYTQTVSSVNYHREIYLVTDKEFNRRMASVIEKPTVKHPIVKLVGDYFYFEPKTIGSAKFSYVKSHTTPNLDYYIDANYREIYFSDPSDIDTWASGTTYNTGDVVKYGTHYYTAKTDGNITTPPSINDDWEYNESYSHLLTTGEEGSLGESAGTVVDSTTVEMGWRDDDKLIIADKILRMMGINLTKEELLAYYNQKLQES